MMQELFQVWNITLPLLPPELKFFTRLWRMPPFTALIERSFAKLVPWSPAHGQGEEDHALSMGQKSVSLFQWLLLNHSPKRGKKRNWKQTWQNSRNLPPPAPQTHTQMKAHIVYMGMGRRRPETPWCQEAIELHGAWISNHVLSTSWDFPAVFYVPHLQHLFSSTWHLC